MKYLTPHCQECEFCHDPYPDNAPWYNGCTKESPCGFLFVRVREISDKLDKKILLDNR